MPGLGDQPQLEFRGGDANECEEFVTAVSRLVLSVGRQRDDNWIADFVASCLAHDALRWWDTLDPSVQQSWKHLRQAMLFKYRPLFYGRSAEEAQTFVRMVRNAALDNEKYNDGRWMAAFASPLFVGEAFRWHSSLGYDVRSNWGVLEQAILTRYDPDPPDSRSSDNFEPNFRGRIRLNSKNFVNHWSCYLSKTLNKDGSISLTSSLDDALEVEFGPTSDGAQCLFIPNNQIPGYNMIGMRSRFKQTDSRANYLTLCAVSSISGARSLKTYIKYQGPVLTKVWSLSTFEKTEASQSLNLCATIGATQLFSESEGAGTKVLFQPVRSMHRAVELWLEVTEPQSVPSGVFQYQEPTGYAGPLAMVACLPGNPPTLKPPTPELPSLTNLLSLAVTSWI